MAKTKSDQSTEPSQADIANAIRHWHRVGRPEHAHQLRELREAGESIPYELLDTKGIRSEKPVEGKLEIPPRSGRGSGIDNWREFAEKVSDMDDAILQTLQRDEIIDILVAREIIPKEDEEENGNGGDEEGDSNE